MHTTDASIKADVSRNTGMCSPKHNNKNRFTIHTRPGAQNRKQSASVLDQPGTRPNQNEQLTRIRLLPRRCAEVEQVSTVYKCIRVRRFTANCCFCAATLYSISALFFESDQFKRTSRSGSVKPDQSNRASLIGSV